MSKNIVEEGLNDQQLLAKINGLDYSSLKSLKPINEESISPDKPILELKKLPDSLFNTNLERFRYLCKDLPSPDLFINFDFLFLISSCLARKVWLGGQDLYRVYPNLYIISVADPGIGKSLPARTVNRLLSSLIERKLIKDKLEEF